jgi:beta-lactamase regulating signal transducer with metallopeptidase domain
LAHDELRFIIKHELVHYKRKDLLYKYLVLAATAIHWFNPVVHLISKAIDVLCEISCDAEVIRNTSADTRKKYSEAIIGVAMYQIKQKTALSTNFNGGKKA